MVMWPILILTLCITIFGIWLAAPLYKKQTFSAISDFFEGFLTDENPDDTGNVSVSAEVPEDDLVTEDDTSDSEGYSKTQYLPYGISLGGATALFTITSIGTLTAKNKWWFKAMFIFSVFLVLASMLLAYGRTNSIAFGKGQCLEGQQWIIILMVGLGFALTVSCGIVRLRQNSKAKRDERLGLQQNDDGFLNASNEGTPLLSPEVEVDPSQSHHSNEVEDTGNHDHRDRRRLIQEKFDAFGLPTTVAALLIACMMLYLFFTGQSISRKSESKTYIAKKPPTFSKMTL